MTRVLTIDDDDTASVEQLQLQIPVKRVVSGDDGDTERVDVETFDCVPNVQGAALANYFIAISDAATSVRGVMAFLEQAIAEHDLSRFRALTADKTTFISFPRLNRMCRALVDEYSGRQFPTLRSSGSSNGQASTTPGSTVPQPPQGPTLGGYPPPGSSG